MNPSVTVVKPYMPLPGSAVGLVTPSSSVSRYPRRLSRALQALTGLGFRPVPAPHAWWDDRDRPAPEALAEDISWCCRREEISAIMCTTGGLRSAELLPHLDFDLLRAARKPLCGFSDITSLLLGVHVRAGIVTFHGPTVVPSMGDADGIDPYSAAGLLAVSAASGLLMFGYWGVASWLFTSRGLWIGYATQALGVTSSAFAALLITSAAERRGRRFVQEALGRYTSPELVKELVAHPEYLSLEWGERRAMSVYFSDIAGFTSFSEKMSPERSSL